LRKLDLLLLELVLASGTVDPLAGDARDLTPQLDIQRDGLGLDPLLQSRLASLHRSLANFDFLLGPCQGFSVAAGNAGGRLAALDEPSLRPPLRVAEAVVLCEVGLAPLRAAPILSAA
jgi:hypothetical protein